MEKYIYLLITKGCDGKFTINAHETLDEANKVLEMYVDAQKEIEGLGDNVYVDYHKYEKLVFPEFVLRDGNILAHVTVNVAAHYDGKNHIMKTDRYIIRCEIR